MLNMSKEQLTDICDRLIDQLTVLKGFIQLNQLNSRIDHSASISQEVDNLEKTINELVKHLLIIETTPYSEEAKALEFD